MWPFSCPHSGHSPLWREGGEYNTRKGNKPAQALSHVRPLGFEPPATSAAVESLAVGALHRRREGIYMADIPVPEARVRELRTLCYILHTIFGAHAIGDYRLVAMILHMRPDAGEQAFAAGNDLTARLEG